MTEETLKAIKQMINQLWESVGDKDGLSTRNN